MIATFVIVSGCLGIRLRTHCRIRHNHKCVSICKDSHAVLCPLQGRNTQSTNLRFVRWVYFALKRRGLVSVVRFCHYTLIRLSPQLPYTGAWHAPVLHTEGKKFTIGSSGAFPPFPDTPVVPFLFLPRLVQSYILYINPALP